MDIDRNIHEGESSLEPYMGEWERLCRKGQYSKAELLCREELEYKKQLDSYSGHVSDLCYWLSTALYRQKKSEEVEAVLRVFLEYEKALPSSIYRRQDARKMLGRTLYGQKRYSEALEVYRVAASEKSQNVEDRTALLNIKYDMAITLQQLNNMHEAEEILRDLGQQDRETSELVFFTPEKIKYRLARCLFEQGKYLQAEEILRELDKKSTEKPGLEGHLPHKIIFWLAQSLFEQGRYDEAEEIFQGGMCTNNCSFPVCYIGQNSIHSRGRICFNRRQYSQAEKIFGDLMRQEDMANVKDRNTFRTRYWLARTLCELGKLNESNDILQDLLVKQTITLGEQDDDTCDTKAEIQRLSSIQKLEALVIEKNGCGTPYTESSIEEVATLLRLSYDSWSHAPRTYIVLRSIHQLNSMDDLLAQGFSDYWFPVTEKSLPIAWAGQWIRVAFVKAQSLILTNEMGLEKGKYGKHCHFQKSDTLPFEERGIIGSGGFAQVDKVLSLISLKEYARKRMLRKVAFRTRKPEDIKQFISEIEILKRLRHRHIVEFVGSYTDTACIALLMTPIADMDLSAYMRSYQAAKRYELGTFFGCLARALEFLHQQKVRHKDIKPSNILVNKGNVLFTDFGLSLDFTDASGSTTVRMVNGKTPRYCAPEVALDEPRNTMSDIWSLGIVFLEMILVLKGKEPKYMDEFFETHGSCQRLIRNNHAALGLFLKELEGVGDVSTNSPLEWTERMLSLDQRYRPSAMSLADLITEEGTNFCGICCVHSDDEDSE